MESVFNIVQDIYQQTINRQFSLLLFIKVLGLFYFINFFYFIIVTSGRTLFCKLISLCVKPKLERYGQWAVVTGSTDGIGKAYAIELAKRNMDIVLISRNIQKLEKCADLIRSQHKVQVKIIQADFTHGLSVYETIDEELKSLDIGILVNNVGIAPSHPTFRPIDDTSKEELWNEIIVNNGAPSQMTRLVLPKMKARKRGMIVYVGSIVGETPGTYFANYAATKSFISSFTEAIETEATLHNVHIQHLIPGIVDTNLSAGEHFMHKLPTSIKWWAYPNATIYASWAISTLGWIRLTTGYWFFDFLVRIYFSPLLVRENRKAVEILLENFSPYIGRFEIRPGVLPYPPSTKLRKKSYPLIINKY